MAGFINGETFPICLLLATIALLWLQFAVYYAGGGHRFGFGNHFNNGVSPPTKIVIAAVSCSAQVDNYKFLHGAEVMLKSVLISAKMDGISEIDLHMFLEHPEHIKPFSSEFQIFLNGTVPSPKLNLFFYSAVEIVPEEHRLKMIYDRRYRCAYTRFFLPSALPRVDSVIYIDSDMIITGSILKYWTVLSSMTANQLVGAASNYEPENTNYDFMLKILFEGIPYVPPRGTNNGLLVMNLTKMREFGWEDKLLRLYNDYKGIGSLRSQKLMNVLLFYNPGLLYKLDCVYNFQHGDCDKGFRCKGAENDTVGVHGVHGTSDGFKVGGVFRSIWEHFEKFDMLSGDIYNDLIYPIRNSYRASASKSSPCFGSLDKQLWKNLE